MALMASITPRRFRTRDPSRDAEADRQRMDAIRAAVVAAIDGATRERTGLKQRVDDYYALVSQIVDNSEYSQRSERQEREAAEAERQGRVGLNRLARIQVELERYRQVLALVDAFRDDQARTGDAA